MLYNRSLANELSALLRVMWSGKWAVVSPHQMLSAIWTRMPFFKGYTQHDAQEFLRWEKLLYTSVNLDRHIHWSCFWHFFCKLHLFVDISGTPVAFSQQFLFGSFCLMWRYGVCLKTLVLFLFFIRWQRSSHLLLIVRLWYIITAVKLLPTKFFCLLILHEFSFLALMKFYGFTYYLN